MLLEFRKKHQDEFQEKLRRKEEREVRKEKERRVREETKRLEREALAERERLSASRAAQQAAEVHQTYDERWAKLLEKSSTNDDTDLQGLQFDDIPWPVMPPARNRTRLHLDDLTKDAVSAFLLPTSCEKPDGMPKAPKDVLRAAMLKFHPDKFEARVLTRVRDEDQAQVKEAGGVVMRILNELSMLHRY